MKTHLIFLSLLLIVCSSCSSQQEPPPAEKTVAEPRKSAPEAVKEEAKKDEGHSLGRKLVFYLPNRILDMLDIFRMRLRVGPGVAAGVRATKVAQAYVGTYAAVYAGLPGPRMRKLPRSPVGLESYNGIDVSLLEASTGGGVGPDYSPTEFGASTQLAILGFDFGFDPVEMLDLAGGLLLLDPRDDDL